MKKILWLILLITIQASVIKRLDDAQTNILTPNDTILSTLGRFRLSVRTNNCSLYIEKFNSDTNKYQPFENCYSQHYKGGSCKYLVVKNGSLYTDNGSIYSKLSNDSFLETALTVDDTGVVRLQGIPDNQNSKTEGPKAINLILQSNRTIDPFIEAHTSLNINTIPKDYQVENKNKWLFTIDNQTLFISSQTDPIIQQFPFRDVLYNETGIYNTSTGKPVDLKGTPAESKSFIRYPYVFQIDEYAPIFRIYDQNKTLLAEYSALDKQVPDIADNIICPDFTFFFRGQCLLQCPTSYFYGMNGTKGACTLTPSSVSQLNVNKKTAINVTNPTYDFNNVRGCPSPSKSYIYGCYCENGLFFDRNKWICTSMCSWNNIQSQLGLCLNCPSNCNQCEKRNDGVKYLNCVSCHTLFTLIDGECVNQSGVNTGNTSTGGNTGNTSTGGNTGNTSTGGNTGNTSTGGNTGNIGNTSTGGNTGNTSTGGNTGNTSTGGNTGNTSTGGNTGNTSTGGNTGNTLNTSTGGNTGGTGNTSTGGTNNSSTGNNSQIIIDNTTSNGSYSQNISSLNGSNTGSNSNNSSPNTSYDTSSNNHTSSTTGQNGSSTDTNGTTPSNQNSTTNPNSTIIPNNTNNNVGNNNNNIPVINGSTHNAAYSRLSSSSDYNDIDASVYPQQDGSYIIYFIPAKPLLYTARLLQQSSSASTYYPFLNDGKFALLNNYSNYGAVVPFNPALKDQEGEYLANSIYGVINENAHNDFMQHWLAYFGYIFSWLIILLHAIYIGNCLIYKVDNLVVLAQTFYYFQFVNLFVGNHLSQFYYGWRWMHGGFFRNFWKFTTPSGYFDIDAPESYKLTTLDADFIRNAGFSLSILSVFLAAWAIISIIILIINKCCCRRDVIYPRIIKNSFFAGIEFFAMNIFYWSVANLMYSDKSQNIDKSYYDANQAASIAFVVIFCAYALIRFCFNRIGGLYMFKKLLIAAILAAAVYNKHGYLAILLALEFVFTIVRFFLERPTRMYEKVTVIVEWLMYSLAYILMFLVKVVGVPAFIGMAIVFIMIILLVSDIMDVYLNSESQYNELKDGAGDCKDGKSPEKQTNPESSRRFNTN